MVELKKILEGWRNDLIPPKELKEAILKISEERLSICRKCIGYDEKGEGCALPFTNPCCNKNVFVGKNKLNEDTKGCGCPLQKKTKCLSCSCPVDNWVAVTTEEENRLIDTLK